MNDFKSIFKYDIFYIYKTEEIFITLMNSTKYRVYEIQISYFKFSYSKYNIKIFKIF